MKRLVWLVLVCAACKSSKPAPAPAADDPQPAEHAGTTPRVSPSLPAPNDVEGSNAPSLPDEPHVGRHHHGDWNGSAMTDEQRAAVMKERADKFRTRLDANGDGKLSYDEVKSAPGRMHFDNPEAIDTNHDGDISSDELAAAMKARLDAFRARRAAQQQGSAAPAADPTTEPQ
jgi:hypothetical protein